MKCPSEVELNEYADDRLVTRRRWEVQEHLEQCTGCRSDLEGLQWTTATLGTLALSVAEDGHPSDEDLAAMAEGSLQGSERARVLTHLGHCAECAAIYGALPRRKRSFVFSQSWSGFAAAAALLLAIGIFYVGGGDRQEPGLAPPPGPAFTFATPAAAPTPSALGVGPRLAAEGRIEATPRPGRGRQEAAGSYQRRSAPPARVEWQPAPPTWPEALPPAPEPAWSPMDGAVAGAPQGSVVAARSGAGGGATDDLHGYDGTRAPGFSATAVRPGASIQKAVPRAAVPPPAPEAVAEAATERANELAAVPEALNALKATPGQKTRLRTLAREAEAKRAAAGTKAPSNRLDTAGATKVNDSTETKARLREQSQGQSSQGLSDQSKSASKSPQGKQAQQTDQGGAAQKQTEKAGEHKSAGDSAAKDCSQSLNGVCHAGR